VITAAATLGPLGVDVDARCYLDPVAPVGGGPSRVADAPLVLPGDKLDPMRARRFDRASRLATLVAQAVLRDRPPTAAIGVVVGTAFGSVAATGAYLRQLEEKGARLVNPAAFPTVLPSALASHPSIYLGLRGPALTCSDLGVSAEAALLTATLLLSDGQADAVVVAAVEEHSEVASAVSSPVNCELDGTSRGEGASALLLERARAARARGARPLAVLAARWTWRGARPELPPPGGAHAATVVARPGTTAPPGWPAPRSVQRAGQHECVGGIALAAAVALLAAGDAEEVLVLGEAPDRGAAFLLLAPPRHPGGASPGARGS
jgi:3-oxoacyl-[acyl-carrier-protein] synthase II